MPIRVLIAVLFFSTPVLAQPLAPGASYDPKIPTIKSVLGYDFGEDITTPDNIVVYLKALAAAAPERTRLVEYGRSWEKRPLYVLLIAAPERMAKLDAAQEGLRQIADARAASPADVERLVRDMPVITLIEGGVHGNEISSGEAIMALAYHLLAARDDGQVLRESIVMLDPAQNPDGRARFLAVNVAARAVPPDPSPYSAEHDEGWPGGRANHYLFDLNRDYFSQSQIETKARTAFYLKWFPHVVVDLHEMGGNTTYYFAPPATPINPHVTKNQVKWLQTFGRANAARFDERGFQYFTREVYDSFYPGYGESWPMFEGAIGMTYEQASARSLAFRRQDGSLLTFHDGVLHHFTSALETAVTSARNREQILRDFAEYRRSAISEGEQGAREYILVPGADRSRAARLASVLAGQGIDVRRADEPIRLGTRTIAAGAYLVSAAQPSGRLIRNLLEPQTSQDDAFVKEQDRRRRLRMNDQIYDVTAWSLPLAFGVECVTSDKPLAVKTSVGDSVAAVGSAKLAYLVPWGSAAASAVAELLRGGVRVDFADAPFTIAGRRFPIGTAIVRVASNADAGDLRARLGDLQGRHAGIEIVPIDSSWTDEGISLGSGQVAHLKTPRIAMAWDAPASSLSAGWMRYVIERRFSQPVTPIRAGTLGNVDLGRFDVLALPSGTYAFGDDMLRRLKDWIRAGGTLVTVGEASRWAAREKVGLLDTRTLLRDGTLEVEQEEKKPGAPAAAPADFEKSIEPERERPENTPGAFLQIRLDPEHWLTAGFQPATRSGADTETAALVESQRVFAPIKLDKGRNVALYQKKDRLLASGLAWDNALSLLAEKPYLIDQPLGRGHVIAFAEDPNYRAFTEATELLFMNAVLLGPGH